MKHLSDRNEYRRELLAIQQHQVELMEHKAQQDLAKEANNVHLVKKYGDALRNSVVKIGNDLLEVIPFLTILNDN